MGRRFDERASQFSGKYFAMLQVFSDETGTGGVQKDNIEPAPGVYGFLATPAMWSDFKDKWKASLKSFKAPYFHFRKLNPNERKKQKNPYCGWDNDYTNDFIYEMAIVASSGPIPLGGNISQKQIVGVNLNKFKQAKIYRLIFYQFFGDFKFTMEDHHPNETEEVSFFQ